MVIIRRKILLDSLRRNPNAGSTCYSIPGKVNILSCGSITREFQRVYSFTPEPKWLYSYEDLYIRCAYCRALFPIERLESDYVTDNVDEEISIDEICPQCGEPECLGKEFHMQLETVEEALKRKSEY